MLLLRLLRLLLLLLQRSMMVIEHVTAASFVGSSSSDGCGPTFPSQVANALQLAPVTGGS
jgi:hypothetical protein